MFPRYSVVPSYGLERNPSDANGRIRMDLLSRYHVAAEKRVKLFLARFDIIIVLPYVLASHPG